MTELVVDCCALVHAKAMARLGHHPLALLDALRAKGLRLWTTPAVLGELVASSLRTVVGPWQEAGSLQTAAPSLARRREVEGRMRRGDPRPGRNDLGLVALAAERRAPLLTHDAAAAVVARRNDLLVLDLADLAGRAIAAGLVELAEVDAAWGDLRGHPWPWPEYPWQGSLCATLDARRGT